MTSKRSRIIKNRSVISLLLATAVLVGAMTLSRDVRNLVEPTAYAAIFTVNTTDDHDDGTCNASDCTLREAIKAANAQAGSDTINFNIPGSGVRTINLTSSLPDINTTISIDGTSQSGFAGTPLIELNGAGAGASATGLSFNSQGSSVTGLIINRFSGYGINIDSFTGVTITGCYIGTNAAGTAAAPNGGGIRVNISGVVIGGSSASARNVISGNTGDGIDIVSGTGTTIQGNYIGLNAAGAAAIPNTANGILISGGGATVGGTAAGTGNVISGNNTSGNFGVGIGIFINGGSGNTIQGNFIGTNPAGTAIIGNASGIVIEGAPNNIIGGTTAGARNIISGNTGAGIGIFDVGATNNVVQGNYVGTNVSGSAALANGHGISVGQTGSNSSGITIGGTTPGAGNLISGNGFEGLLIINNIIGLNVQGNLIGTDATGTAAIPNVVGIFINTTVPGAATIGGTTAATRNIISGNTDGISLNTFSTGVTIQGNYIGTDITGNNALGNTSRAMFISTNNTIVGGSSAGAGNVISGNFDGIEIGNSSTGNLIQGNFIGTKADGVSALGNTGDGIAIFTGSSNNTVGGTSAGTGNTIAFNRAGVTVDTGTGNAILRNSIFSNNNLGIDLSPTGINQNDDCDLDSGPNNLDNFPVLASATEAAGNTTIAGTLNSNANGVFRIEFFSNSSTDPSGNGEGQVFLGTTNVTTNGSCNANILFTVPTASVTGPYVTATATDSNGNTSEFSASVPLQTTNAVLQFSAPTYTVGEADGKVTLTVNRTVDTAGISTVDFATGNNQNKSCIPGDPQNTAGQATQNCDFTRTLGTLTFNPGDTSKSFDVLITNDAYVENSETFPTALSNPTGGILGALSTASTTIVDNDTAQVPNPAQFRFEGSLSGGQETPANNATGKGIAMFLLGQNQTSGLAGLLFSGLTSAQTGAHIHGPGAPGVPAPILFPLPNGTVTNFTINGFTAQNVSDLKSQLHYMNVHTQNFQGGELRAQLLWNPLAEEDFFVTQMYSDFLQRQSDPGGFTYWRDQVATCQANAQCFDDRTIAVSNAFFYEQEYQQTAAYAYRLFRAAYGNTQPSPNGDNINPGEANKIPSYDAFYSLRARVIGGANLAAGQLDAASVLVARPEFIARYPANLTLTQFVDAVLNTIKTDIGPDLNAQKNALVALGSRAAVMYRIANDDLQGGNGGINNRTFIDGEYNRGFVITLYFGYLRRDGDVNGFLFWLGQVNSAPLRDPAKQNAMVCSFYTSTEYENRFGPNATRNNRECPGAP